MLRGGLLLGMTLLAGCGSSSAGGPAAGGSSSGEGAGLAGQATAAGAAGSSSATSSGGNANAAGQTGLGGGSNAGGTSTAGGGATLCNDLVNSAPVITEQAVMVSEPPAPPVGGTIADGTYYETSYVTYSVDTPPMPSTTTLQFTAQITGSTFQGVFVDDKGQERITMLLTPNGSMLGEEQTCRTNAPFMMTQLAVLGYDATSTTFTIHFNPDYVNAAYPIQTLTKQ